MENTLDKLPTTSVGNTQLFNRSIEWGIKAWIVMVFAGQWMFALYIAAQFGLPFFSGTIDESQFAHMIKGYINGDDINNGILLLHILPVFIIGLCAPLQLVPAIRKRYPVFHRWNGRMFFFIGVTGALTGLYLTWIRETHFGAFSAMGITLNGLLIPISVYFAWRFAINKRFDLHRRFAVHAFILINAVWTLRLYLMGWFMIHQGPYGNTNTMDGPADIAISYACYLLPMLAAEIVFWAEKQRKKTAKAIALMSLASITVVTMIGVVSASLMMWWPKISAAFS